MPDRAQAAPLALFVLIAVGFGWQLLYYDQPLPGFDPANKVETPNNTSEDTFGFFSPIAGALEAVFGGIQLFASLLTFSLVEGPSSGPLALVYEFFKWAWRLVVIGGLLWAIIEVFAP